ncbi:hypothetical protein CRE_00455 [Caenorhabditis remanei]|uniref:Uncharacterized protein n=1 Tax=Caenorhabditis remanei TaxID=31234 RepID=E3LCS2_CAERE|nr:hypothetical protein CRE_00455 [Caenorhabditis remanei]
MISFIPLEDLRNNCRLFLFFVFCPIFFLKMTAVADESSDVFFLVSVVAPLLFCCFAIFVCALNSIWKTRSKLEALTQVAKQREPTEYTEFTIDLTTKMDSCVELSSPQISSKEVTEISNFPFLSFNHAL